MLSYSFSAREKFLMLLLVVVLVVVAWFMLVYQRTTNEIIELDNRIAAAQSEQAVLTGRLNRLKAMEQTIKDNEAAGVTYAAVPEYDNMTALMAELDRVMSAAGSYTVSFDELDRSSASGYVLRGVRIVFDCGSYNEAQDILKSLANGAYPCSISSVEISGRSSGSTSGVTVSARVVFVEKAA